MLDKKVVVWEVIPTLGGGGAEKMVLDLTDGLKNSDHMVKIISLYDDSWMTQGRIDFVKQHNLSVMFLKKKIGFDFRLLLQLISMIKKEKPDIVHSHLGAFQYIEVACFFTKFLHVHTLHSVVGNESFVHKILIKIASRMRNTSFVVLSYGIGESMKSLFGTFTDYISCIRNGVDSDYYAYKERDYKTKVVHFITVGSLIPVKNQKLLIEAFEQLEKERGGVDKLTIVGEGFLHEKLIELVKKYGLDKQIIFTGNVSDVRKYLYESDVFVMTSHYEGVSLALLEAAATGLPIIAAKTGGTPELVGDSVVLFEDDNLQELIEDMRSASNESFRSEYAKRARCLAEKNSKKKMILSYIKLYDRIVQR